MLSKRILIYRKGAIGDVVQTLPLVKLLRKNNPSAQIEYCTGPVQVDLLENCTDYIDKVWTIVDNQFAEATKLLTSLNLSPADEFIYLHSNWLKAHWFNWRYIKARKLYCYKTDMRLSAVDNYVMTYPPSLVLQHFGARDLDLDWQTLNADKYQPSSAKESSYICVVPGVGSQRPHRAYPLSRWLEFIQSVLSHSDLHIYILGGPDELELSQAIEETMVTWSDADRARITNLIAQTSLVETAGIISGAEHLYSADTGLVHMAAALGVPLTALFSITSEQRFGPYSPKVKVLRSASCKCHPGLAKHCDNPSDSYASCMYDILSSSLTDNLLSPKAVID